MNKLGSLLVFLLIVVGGGLLIGALTAPGAWYTDLQKPFFNPPNWVFGPVWTVLYVIIAFVGWRVWQRSDGGFLKVLWGAQLVLNFLWSPVFFAAQQPLWALGVIVALLIVIVLFIRSALSRDRWSGVLFLPYLAWVAYATALNAAIVVLN